MRHPDLALPYRDSEYSQPKYPQQLDWLIRSLPGVAIAVGIALLATMLQSLEERLIGHAILEALVLAIIVGVIVRTVFALPDSLTLGIDFTAKQVLECAIVLLGASVDVPTVLRAGPALIVGIVVIVALAITLSMGIGRLLGLNPKLAILVAVGNSICGNSAIAAVAPVIDAAPEDVASAIALTAVLGVVVVLTLPLLITVLGLTLYQYGVLAGLSVYAVPQVLAATFPVSAISGKVGTLVKLVRVLLLGPVVLIFSLRQGRADATRSFSLTRYVPWFIIGFITLAALRSLGLLPVVVADPLRIISGWLTIAAMAALGLGVDIRAVRQAGVRVIIAIILSLICLITLSASFIHFSQIGVR